MARFTSFAVISIIVVLGCLGGPTSVEAIPNCGTVVASSVQPGFIALGSLTDGILYVYVDITDPSVLPGGEACFAQGLQFSINTEWNALATDAVGIAECSSFVTGGQYDPTIACSPLSANPYCRVNGGIVPPKCFEEPLTDRNVAPDAAKEEDAEALEVTPQGRKRKPIINDCPYSCNPYSFSQDQFVCTVGDVSGQFGNLPINNINPSLWQGNANYANKDWNQSCLFTDKSLVVSCSNGLPAFCMRFVEA